MAIFCMLLAPHLTSQTENDLKESEGEGLLSPFFIYFSANCFKSHSRSIRGLVLFTKILNRSFCAFE